MDEHITSKTSLWSLVIFESVSVIKTYFMNQTIWKSHGHVKFKSSQSGLPIYHSCPSPPSNLNPPCLLAVQLYCPHSSSFANQIIQSVILCFNGLTKRKKNYSIWQCFVPRAIWDLHLNFILSSHNPTQKEDYWLLGRLRNMSLEKLSSIIK